MCAEAPGTSRQPHPRLPLAPAGSVAAAPTEPRICKSAHPPVFRVAQSLSQVKAREFRSHKFSVSDNDPAVLRARARLQDTELRVTDLLKQCETGHRPRRAWLARARAAGSPWGHSCPSALRPSASDPRRGLGCPRGKTVWRPRAHWRSSSNEKSEN